MKDLVYDLLIAALMVTFLFLVAAIEAKVTIKHDLKVMTYWSAAFSAVLGLIFFAMSL